MITYQDTEHFCPLCPSAPILPSSNSSDFSQIRFVWSRTSDERNLAMCAVLCVASGENMEVCVKCRMHAGHCAGGICIDYFVGSKVCVLSPVLQMRMPTFKEIK